LGSQEKVMSANGGEKKTETRTLGQLWPVSSLTMGGGGIGQVWGATDRDESVATLREAVDSGITLIDVAPSYGLGEAELVVGQAFDGRLPDGVRVCTKSHVGDIPVSDVDAVLERSLAESLERMAITFVDLFVLHSPIVATKEEGDSWRTPLALYREAIRPAMGRLVEQGRIGAWGITAAHPPSVVETVLAEDALPAAAQMVANVLDAPGDMRWSDEPARPRDLIALADKRGVGVMGIRVVQAGALTDSLDRDLAPDHPAQSDFDRAAPFRSLAAELGESSASLAYRYALSMYGVDTVVLGVKNRNELRESVRAAELGPLPADVLALVDERMGPLRIIG
jgi:aryl-alcohol dehydrogenase-like predicted oxidoreductase